MMLKTQFSSKVDLSGFGNELFNYLTNLKHTIVIMWMMTNSLFNNKKKKLVQILFEFSQQIVEGPGEGGGGVLT